MLDKFIENKNGKKEMSFLGHLEELRWHLIRSVIVVLSLAIFFFLQKEFIFDKVILAPKFSNFWTYRMLCQLSNFLGMGDALCISDLPFKFVSTLYR